MHKLCSVQVLGLVLAVVFGSAQPSMAGHRTPPTCPYGKSYDDGCAKSRADGSYINANFFSFAKQSGQGEYYSAPSTPSNHPPPWNVAGVDYPVGYPTSRKLKDPAAEPLPAGCTYSATGSDSGGAIVVCNHVANVSFDGWDFSLHGCTPLDIKNYTSGVVRILNSKFVNGPNCSTRNGYLVTVEDPAPVNVVFESNFVDGNAKKYPTSLTAMLVLNNVRSTTLKYNAFLHSPGRPISSSSVSKLDVAYNYWEGFVYQDSDGHGEVIINVLENTFVKPSITYSFNTVLQPNNVLINGTTAMFYASTSQSNATIMATVIDHNTSIANLNAGHVTTSAASAETSYDTYGKVLFQQNYMDPTGAYSCFVSISNPTYLTPPVFSGNVNMINGHTVDKFDSCK
jgi:hypothetical protein